MYRGVYTIMPVIKRLNAYDIKLFQETIIRFIYESTTHAAYVDSFAEADAEQKCAELINYLNEGKAMVYGAVKDNALIGFVWAYEYPFREDKSRIYVSILYIDEHFRGQKIGNYLLSEIENEAARQGYSSVFLHTEGSNDGAIKFYDRMGYEMERIQLVKRVVNEIHDKIEPVAGTPETSKGGVQILTARMINKYRDVLTELFLLNAKAHILTDSFDYIWAANKINDLVGYVKKDKAVVAGYFINENLVGFMWVFPYKYRYGERYRINAIVVFPEYRNMCIASKLFEFMESVLYEGKKLIYTHVDVVNSNAYRFYKSHGMKEENYQMIKRIKNV